MYAHSPALTFSLTGGNCHDAPEGRKRVMHMERWHVPMVMDKAYAGDETQYTVANCGFIPIVPPKSNRLKKWEHDTELYKKRNIVERLFRRLKGFRRIATRYDKLDAVFVCYIHFCLALFHLK